MASAEPRIGRWASQITPSRSQMMGGRGGASDVTGLDAAMPGLSRPAAAGPAGAAGRAAG